ncbi:thiamine-phosphate pyrophosphorylase [Nonlabens sp. Hel1_33_55]|uniref:thiamine phosphate synthase n=1 Tax=Nonlabens sp. Hel1_33_55 TaxID=1336802 RepID=UPI000875CC04|nr:thiamine phosphate synthase [Nonlabens sp. Hel1_33_55]SCY04493.1 thiamine-phosphate pyrophosphorylase [Nonlabens sp. Hel1_33_55]
MIPKLHYVSNAKTPQEHLENIQKACSAGIELVQLDMRHIKKAALATLAADVLEITSHFQTRLIINSHYQLAKTIKADGVFLDKTDAAPTLVRKQLFPWQTIGAGAHTLQDCEQLIANEVDYIVLGPFKTSDTSLNKALGLNGYTAIAEALQTETPLIGSGSITTNDVKNIISTGISGLALSQELTADFNLIKTYHQLLNASSTQEMRHSF